jgi:hypothetical protein
MMQAYRVADLEDKRRGWRPHAEIMLDGKAAAQMTLGGRSGALRRGQVSGGGGGRLVRDSDPSWSEGLRVLRVVSMLETPLACGGLAAA